jgi:hypothetical protein
MCYEYLLQKIFRDCKEEPTRRHQYKDKTIRLVSILLSDGRWLLTAQIISITGFEKHFQGMTVDVTKAVESRDKADAIALVMAKRAID